MEKQDICLNIGCWLDVAEGWLNIDSSPYIKVAKIPLISNLILTVLKAPKFPPSIYCGDLVKGLNIEANSCQLIFASHVLEHLTLNDFNTALKHLYQYLKPQGIFRIIIPDLEAYIQDYQQQLTNPESSHQAAYNFMNNSGIGYSNSRKTLLQRLKEIFSNSRHQWMWDEPSLRQVLTQHGFKNIRRCQYGDWQDSRFELVEKSSRHWHAICLEASK